MRALTRVWIAAVTAAVMLAMAPAAIAATITTMEVVGLKSGEVLNIRSKPSTSATVLATVKRGATLYSTGCQQIGSIQWCKVQTTGSVKISGWANGRYLEEADDEDDNPPPPKPKPPKPKPPEPPATFTCRDDPRDCIDQARRECYPDDYRVLDNYSYAGGRNSDRYPGPYTWYSLTVRCGDFGGQRPTFPFRGPVFQPDKPNPPPKPTPPPPPPPPPPPKPKPPVVTPVDPNVTAGLPDACMDQATRTFGVASTNVQLNPVVPTQSGYAIDGKYDNGNVQAFTCNFTSDGSWNGFS